MLVSHEYRFIVALPTKCGTNSMRNMGLRSEREGRADELQELSILRHRMDVPEGCEFYTRAIVMRNPWSRLVSMYEYLRRHSWEWRYADIMYWERRLGRARAWTEFLEMLVEERAIANGKPYMKRKLHGRRPYIWTDTQLGLSRFLGGVELEVDFPWPASEVRVLRLENLAADWRTLCVTQGWNGPPMPKHNNATRGEDKLWPDWRRYFASARNRELGRELVGEDWVLSPEFGDG